MKDSNEKEFGVENCLISQNEEDCPPLNKQTLKDLVDFYSRFV